MTTIALSPDTIRSELKTVAGLVGYWQERLEQGVPGVEMPGTDEALEAVLRQFVGEMLFVSGKCQNMAMILAER